MKIKITGQVERIVFQNPENNYTVARLLDKDKLTTIIGNMAINPGETIELEGKWVDSKKYGPQFQVESYRTVLPTTLKGIEKYLGSGLIKGIGPELAKRITKQFKEHTLDIIENYPEKLLEVDGIGEKRIEKIKKAWEDQKEIKDIMIFLQSHNVSPAFAAKIYKTYGYESIKIVTENPYRLAEDIHGVGFISADRIAKNLGIRKDSLIRIKEGVIFVLQKAVNDGHVYCPADELISKSKDLLEVNDSILEALNELEREGRITREEDRIYLSWLYVTEVNLAKRLKYLKENRAKIRKTDTDKAIDWVQKKLKIVFAEKQKEAISAATKDKVLIITGGPGTGKTTIIRAILEILEKLTSNIILTAPTGRAAKRMEETTGRNAKTIHRLLEYSPGGFRRNQDNPLKADMVIVDEASMIDISLMYNLVKAIPPHAILILVGDIHQLPSVGPGNVLADIIDSEEFKTIYLDEIFRQSQKSKIVVNAHKINKGFMPDTGNDLEGDFFFFKEEDPEKAARLIVDLCKNRIPKNFGFKPRDIQVLSPMHRGAVGVGNLNKLIQEQLNRNTKYLKRGDEIFKLGDRVMQIKNNYDKDVYNGDIGEVVSLDTIDQELKIKFDNRIVTYDYSDLDEITLSYAASIHKSQGSEFPVVIIPVMTQHYILLQRNLVYTGVTRGKKLVVLVGTKKALAIAIKNNDSLKRHTRLKEKLREVILY